MKPDKTLSEVLAAQDDTNERLGVAPEEDESPIRLVLLALCAVVALILAMYVGPMVMAAVMAHEREMK